MDKLNVIIPLLKGGSKLNDLELKYALRSIEKHLKDYNEIYILSNYLPNWIQNVNLIMCPQNSNKTRNIKTCINNYFEFTQDENVFFTNDDIFLLKDVSCINYPYYYSNKAEQEIADRNNNDIYKKLVIETNKVLNEKGIEEFNYFDIHCPIRYNRLAFNEYVNKSDWSFKYGLIIKSLYANQLRIKPIEIEDVYIKELKRFEEITSYLLDKSHFTIHDRAINPSLIGFLNTIYPNKSKYEK